MPEWEYATLDRVEGGRTLEAMNVLGAKGWEYVGHLMGNPLFRREKDEPKATLDDVPEVFVRKQTPEHVSGDAGCPVAECTPETFPAHWRMRDEFVPLAELTEDPRDSVSFHEDDEDVRWFINECGDVYPYPMELQEEHFPNDDHEPYASKEEAEEAANPPVKDFEVEVIFRLENRPEGWTKDDAWNWVNDLLHDVAELDEFRSGSEEGDGVVWATILREDAVREVSLRRQASFLLDRIAEDLTTADTNSMRRQGVENLRLIEKALTTGNIYGEHLSASEIARLQRAKVDIAAKIFGLSQEEAQRLAGGAR